MRKRLRFITAVIFMVLSGFAFSAPSVDVLPSGIKIETIKEGTGSLPGAFDRVKVHYHGMLIDGTEFDSSYSRGKPATFSLRGVIRCWTESLQKMKVGGKARLTCPPSTAYGSRGVAGVIPPNSTLVFEVELLDID